MGEQILPADGRSFKVLWPFLQSDNVSKLLSFSGPQFPLHKASVITPTNS